MEYRTMKSHAAAAALVLLVLTAWVPGAAPGPEAVPRPDEGTVVGRSLPDIGIELADGKKTSLSALGEKRPLILTLVFSRCAGVCSPFLRTIRSVADDVGGVSVDYDFLVLSFDSRDTAEEMGLMAEYVGAGRRAGWNFGVAGREDIGRLAGALGFQFRWSEEAQQFDHPAVLVAMRDGRVLRMVTGGAVSHARFREVVSELRGDFVPIYPTMADVRFRCFEFGPDGVARPSWGMLIVAYPAMVTALITGAIFLLVRPPGSSPECEIQPERI